MKKNKKIKTKTKIKKNLSFPKISLTMLAKNEASCIGNAIESIKSIVFEIILVDTGSTDSTVDICRKLGAKIFSTEWRDDFSLPRNLAIDKAQGEWIFCLDPDEIISGKDLNKIVTLTLNPRIQGYSFITRNYCNMSELPDFIYARGEYPLEEKGFSGYIESTKVRLFRNRKEYRFENAIHEIVDYTILKSGGNIGKSLVPVHHFGQADRKEIKKKISYYASLGKKEILLNPGNSRAHFDLGKNLYSLGDTEGAIRHLNEAVKLSPEFSDAWIKLGLIQLLEDNLEQASEILNHAQKLSENNPELIHGLGVLFYKIEKFDLSLDCLKRAIKLNSNYGQAFLNLAILYRRIGNILNAAEAIKKAVDLMPDNEKVLILASSILIQAGHFEKAYDYLNILKINGCDSSEFLNNMGAYYSCIKAWQKAKEYFAKAIEKNPELKTSKNNLEKIAPFLTFEQNKISGSITLCVIVKNEEYNIRECLDSAKDFVDEIVVVDTGSTDNTVRIAKEMGAKVYNFPWIDDFAAARNESLRNATCGYVFWMDADDRLSPESGPLLRKIIMMQEKEAYFCILNNLKGDLEGTKLYQLRIFPRLPNVNFTGKIHEQVLSSLKDQNIPLKKCDIEIIHKGYMESDLLNKKHERNLAILKKAVQENPHDYTLMYHFGISLKATEDFKSAIETFQKVIENQDCERERKDILLHSMILMGKCLEAIEDHKTAEEIFLETLKKEPDYFLGAYCLGLIKEKKGEIDEAVKLFKTAAEQEITFLLLSIPVQGVRFLSYAKLGNCYRKQGALKLAKKAFFQSLLIKNNLHSQVYQSLAEIYLMEKNTRIAASCYRKASLLQAENPDFYVFRANQYFYTNYEKAEILYQKALDLDGNIVSALSNMGKLKLLKGDLEQSIYYFDKAMELSPQMKELLPLKGDALYKSGKFYEAIDIYSKYIEGTPESYITISRLADCYFQLGHIKAASLGYIHALKIAPGYAPARENLMMIKEINKKQLVQ